MQALSIRKEETRKWLACYISSWTCSMLHFSGSVMERKRPSDWSPSSLLPPSCKSFKRLSVCLSPPDSVSGLIPAGWRSQIGGALMLSDAASTVTSRSISDRVLSRAAARLCEEHGGLCQIGDWQPGLLHSFCWIKTCFYGCWDRCCLFSLIWRELKVPPHTQLYVWMGVKGV